MQFQDRPFLSYLHDYFPSLLGALSEFEAVTEAEPGDDGLIEAALIPLRENVIYPNMVSPLFIERDSSMRAIEGAKQTDATIICATQKDPDIENPKPKDIYTTGIEAAIGKLLRMPDGTSGAIIQARRRVEIVEFTATEPYFMVKARIVPDETETNAEVEAQMRAVLELFEKTVALNRRIPEDAYVFAMNIDEPGWLADLIASTLDLTIEQQQSLLQTSDSSERLMHIGILLAKEIDVLEIEDRIFNRVQEEVDKGQRELYLREQMRAIQVELGELDMFQQETLELRDQIIETKMTPDVEARALKELGRLSGMASISPEASITRTYIEWLLDLPWQTRTEDKLDLETAAAILDEEHYGLKKAKERILEYIAVRKLAPDKMKTPILCFVGPPGTGKTSLGQSIAKALGREFVRVSLGGVRDEAEIRGHRRTYVGAMPGRIIQTMQRAGTVNPLMMLDEIDKLGMDFHGDPSAALLEVLDPEQNHSFSDHYLEVDYSLSEVMFITTANFLDPIPEALLDRLEIIEFLGYIEEEKLEIARRFLIPKQLEANGIEDLGIKFETKALLVIMRDYTYEAGVRNLERELANICRKIARRVAEHKSYSRRVTEQSLLKYLGPTRVNLPILSTEPEIGVAQGVAWTEVGGDILPVEVTLMPGKGNLTLTGQLGEVMQESAQAALSYTRSRADDLELDPEIFENTDVHIHLPEGAIPKDGPSAGVTLATALVSAFTERPIRPHLVMTGEITLRGRVLAVGGIREKLLAAHRVSITDVIIPRFNEKDLIELPRKARRDLNIRLVDHMDDILDFVLLEAEETEDSSEAENNAAASASDSVEEPASEAESAS